MKIRSDYVSNSSSSSFILAWPKGRLNDVIDAVSAACMEHASPDEMESGQPEEQNEFNRAVLGYHWRASERLFLGMLTYGYRRAEYRKGDFEFEDITSMLDKGGLGYTGRGRLVSRTEDLIEMDWPLQAFCPVVPTHDMNRLTGVYMFKAEDYDDTSKYAAAAANIVEMMSNEKRRPNLCSTYFISRRTIWNTRALLASGMELDLDPWIDLDRLDERLKNGDLILAVRVNQGGDGVDDDAVYSFGGWDGQDVTSTADIEVLDSETM